jgi:uncharacterized protein YndB with AHSA1/START domain
MAAVSTDRIQNETILKAPRSRVWEFLGNAEEFGKWFGVEFAGQQFAPGGKVAGRFTDPDMADGMLEAIVEEVVPGQRLTFRWWPGKMEPNPEHPEDQTTLVVFELTEVAEGTMVRVTESGFDGISLARRAELYRSHVEGWEIQLKAFGEYVHSRI